MDLPTAVLRDLLQLATSIDFDDEELEPPLLSLASELRTTISSYRGLSVTVVKSGYPVTLSALPPAADREPIVTSIRVPLAALGDGLADESRIVCYAGASGAFVDLAADLEYALRASTSEHEMVDRCRAIVLDADLPPPTLISGITGLQELSTINRAIGMLIVQGHSVRDAEAGLHRRAVAAGVESHRYATRLLSRNVAP